MKVYVDHMDGRYRFFTNRGHWPGTSVLSNGEYRVCCVAGPDFETWPKVRPHYE